METDTAPDTGRLTVAVVPNVVPIPVPLSVDDDDGDAVSLSAREGTASLPTAADERSRPAVPPGGNGNVPREREQSELAIETVYAEYMDRPREAVAPADGLDWLARLVAIGMAIVTAYFSIHGLLTLFPGDEIGVTVFGIGVEFLKVAGVMYLSAHARSIWWLWRWLAILAVIIAAGLNSASVYAKFAALHSQSPAAAAAVREGASGATDARIEYLAGRVTDLGTQIRQADDALTASTQKGRRAEAEAQRKTRTTLSGQRDAAANELAQLKASRAGLTAAGHQAAAEELPVTLMASLAGVDAATVLRWLVCAVVICGDPAALVMLAAVGSRRRRGGSAA